MKRFLNIRTMMITFMLLLAAISASAVERPFAITINGMANFIVNEAGIPVGATINGSGNATHLGLTSLTGTLQFAPSAPGSPVANVNGQGTLTAADGDKVDFVLENGLLDLSNGLGHGNVRFVGGTGRFANASGLTEFVVLQSPTGAFEVTIVGSIDY